MPNKHIVTIGIKGFPYGTAPIKKAFFMAKSLVECDNSFLVISNSFVRKNKGNENLTRSGCIDGISYYCTVPRVFSPKKMVKKIYYKIYGKFNEFVTLIRLRLNHKLDVAIIYSHDFFYTFFYSLFLRLLGSKTYVIYFELYSKFEESKSLAGRINDYLFDNYIFFSCNGMITISKFLADHIALKAPGKKYIVVPPIVNFKDYNLCSYKNSNKPYFLFCGSLAYLEVMHFILESYNLIKDKSAVDLIIVASGKEKYKGNLFRKIDSMQLNNRVSVLSNLSDEELRYKYMNAYALLIPLRSNIQDKARFPQKIAEYCAARRPIITTNYGEVVYYFDHNSALIANSYETNLYGEKLLFAIQNKDKMNSIAEKSYELGRKYFDYKVYGSKLYDFMIEN